MIKKTEENKKKAVSEHTRNKILRYQSTKSVKGYNDDEVDEYNKPKVLPAPGRTNIKFLMRPLWKQEEEADAKALEAQIKKNKGEKVAVPEKQKKQTTLVER